MRLSVRLFMILIFLGSMLSIDSSGAHARGSAPVEISATYGSMWGGNIQTTGGKIRTGTGGSLGLALDFAIGPDTWIEANYTQQDGSLDWEGLGEPTRTLTDMSVNYWQLGAIQTFGNHRGSFLPFFSGALGATYMSPAESSILIGGEPYNIEAVTKFSIALGLGFKAYLGQSQRIAIKGSFKMLSTFFDTGGGVWFGPGGVTLGLSGSGLWQYEAAGGLVVRFGGS